jgi:hypothetical protein
MGGRFLYGDSEPFPGGYDFLAALRQFVAASSRALVLAHEADELERSLGERAQEHLYAIETIQTFFTGLGDLIAERAARSGSPQIVGPYAAQVVEHVEAVGAHARALRSKELDGASVEVTSRIRERRAEIRQVIADYLLSGPLPVLSWAISLNLAGTAPNGQAVLEHPGDVSTSVAIDVTRDATWNRARRLGDIVPGMTMQVGFKKAFLRSSLHPDVVALDEHVIAVLELGPDSMELRLRRKLDAPRDAFVLTVDPDENGKPLVKVTRMDERGGGSADPPFVSEGDEARRVLELVSILRGECSALLAHKKRLLSAQLDGHDVFERSLVPVLLQRIADRLTPIATEVSRHSPNPSELSLKFEREGGRREEVYLKKAELVAMVAGLPPELLQVFSGLAFLPPQSVEIDVSVAEPTPPPIELASVRPARPSAAPPPPKRKW